MRSWFMFLIALCLAGPGVAFAQGTSAQSAEAALPAPESIGTGWSLLSSDTPTDLARPFRDASTALYAGPNGARARVTVLLVVEGMTAIRESWELSNEYFESLRGEIDYDFDSSRERELEARALPPGCDDGRRTYGRDELFGDAFQAGITLCAADPDVIVLAYASGEVGSNSGYEASDYLVGLVVSADSDVEAGNGDDGEADAEEPATSALASVDVFSYDIYFEPTEVAIPADTDVNFVLTNGGAALHNFAIDALGINVDLHPGTTEEIVINAPAGEYEYYCNIPGHMAAGMVGMLTVQSTSDQPVTADENATSEASAGTTEQVVTSFDIFFEPRDIAIPANTDVSFRLPNDGVTLHNFSIDELGVDINIQPSETAEVLINAPPGSYEYYCSIPGHREAGMVGTMTVE